MLVIPTDVTMTHIPSTLSINHSKCMYVLLLTCLATRAYMSANGDIALSAIVFNVTVFAPVCSDTFNTTIFASTVELAEDSINANLSILGYRLSTTLVDTCLGTEAMAQVSEALSTDSVNAIVGTGIAPLCSPVAIFAEQLSKAFITWDCMSFDWDGKNLHPTLLRTIPSADKFATALSEILLHFRWKRVAIFYTTDEPWLSISKNAYFMLSNNGFQVQIFHELPAYDATNTVFNGTYSFTNIKAIVVCANVDVLPAFMHAAEHFGANEGDHAFIFFDITALAVHRGDEMNSSDSDLLDGVFLISTHPETIDHNHDTFELTINETEYVESLYNAISLLGTCISTILSSSEEGQNVTFDGETIARAARDTMLPTIHGMGRTDDAGDLMYSIFLMDFREPNAFVAVLEYSSVSKVLETIPGSVILWPNGKVLSADVCDFEPCVGGFRVEYIGAVVVFTCVIGALMVVGVFVVRRRLVKREMEKGPNKILLMPEDLIFLTSKSMHKSMRSMKSLFEKPDVVKASEPSSSNSSYEFSEYSEVARYNGDMVFAKELKIRNFEIKGKVLHFLKQLRDLRHENVNGFIGCFVDSFRPALVMEYCPRRSLEDILSNETIKLDWDFKLSLLTDLVKGMRYLHGSPIRSHGHLSSGNCVIDSRWVLKLTDHGLHGMYQQYSVLRERKAKHLLWTAPEVLRVRQEQETSNNNTGPHSVGNYTFPQKADVYSFALVLQEIVLRGHPFCMLDLDPEEIIKKVRKPPPLCRPSVSQGAAPPQYIQIMKQCWAENPDMRPDFEHVHQQIKEINKGKKNLNIVDTMFKMLETYSTDLEELVRERTVAFEEEKKKTENLLKQMLPASVAQALLSGQPVEAETYQESTIYFSDIVGFTTISAMSTPMQVVDLLNDLYTVFDGTIDDYDVYKVETIGDAYMVASGLPNKNGNRHAGEIATMALDLLSQCGVFKIRHHPEIPLRLRIGLHSGPCVAGVVGLRMPRYCLFGDTVNTASRMESTGSAFRIHVSPTTKTVLDDLGGYILDYRGVVELKGKGDVKSYWLVGKTGFNKPLPEPPPLDGADNHGLKEFMPQSNLQKLRSAKLVGAVKKVVRKNSELKTAASKGTLVSLPEGSTALTNGQMEETETNGMHQATPTDDTRLAIGGDASSAIQTSNPIANEADVNSNHRTNADKDDFLQGRNDVKDSVESKDSGLDMSEKTDIISSSDVSPQMPLESADKRRQYESEHIIPLTDIPMEADEGSSTTV